MKAIVIVGAGFAGANAAKEILKKLPAGYKLALVNRFPYFAFKPLLHEVATGVFGKDVVCEQITSFLRHKNFEFAEGAAAKIDLKRGRVAVGKTSIRYDYLLIAVGAQTNFFNIPGAGKYALKLDLVYDAFRIKNAITDISKKAHPKVVVVGAGPTGVELSTEVAAFLAQMKRDFSVTVIELSPVLLPQVKENFRNAIQRFFDKKNIKLLLGTGVVKVGKNYVVTDKKQKLSADIIIWAAGVKPSAVAVLPKTALSRGYFPVDGYFRLKGYKNVFAAGDCAFARNPDGVVVPQLAQSAEAEGKFVAENIVASINREPLKRFVFRKKGFILPLANGYAVAEVKGFVFSGFFAWWLNRIAYLYAMLSFRHKIYVKWRWFIGLFKKRNSSLT